MIFVRYFNTLCVETVDCVIVVGTSFFSSVACKWDTSGDKWPPVYIFGTFASLVCGSVTFAGLVEGTGFLFSVFLSCSRNLLLQTLFGIVFFFINVIIIFFFIDIIIIFNTYKIFFLWDSILTTLALTASSQTNTLKCTLVFVWLLWRFWSYFMSWIFLISSYHYDTCCGSFDWLVLRKGVYAREGDTKL